MLPESRPRPGARFRRLVFAPFSYRHALAMLSTLVAWLLVSPAVAEFPFSRGGSSADPYAYQNYMFISDADDRDLSNAHTRLHRLD
jgi:hypothetical protein